jgi:hypothetical protein
MKVAADFKFIPQFAQELPKKFQERKGRNFQWQEVEKVLGLREGRQGRKN